MIWNEFYLFHQHTPLPPSFCPKTLLFSFAFFTNNKEFSPQKKGGLNTCSKESAQNIINPFTALITESVVNFQPRLHVLRRVLRRVKERESARKRNRRGKPLGWKRKKKKRSQIVPSAWGGRGGSLFSFVSLFLRDVDVFSFFFGRKVLSPQKVRETFGRRTAHVGRTHALRWPRSEEDGRYLPLSIRGFLDGGIVEKKRGDDHV